MATVQMNSRYQGLYRSPYFISTYDKQPMLDPGQTKVPDEQGGKDSACLPSSDYLVSGKGTIINLDSDDDDGFVDIDELLSDKQQRNILPCGGTAEKMDVECASGKSFAFNQLNQGSNRDLSSPAIDTYIRAESETDYRNLKIDLTTTNYCNPPHNAVSDSVYEAESGSRITCTSDRVDVNHYGDDNDGGIVDDAWQKFAPDLSRPALPEITHGIAICGEPNVTKAENEISGVADDDNDTDTWSTKGSDRSRDELAPDHDNSVSEPLEYQYGRNGDEPSDDSNDEDYDDDYDEIQGAEADELGGSSCYREAAKRARKMKPDDVETTSTYSLAASCPADAATSSACIQKSEEIPIHGYLTLKTIDSKVVYCLTFSQQIPLESDSTTDRDDAATHTGLINSEALSVHQRSGTRPAKNSRFSSEEDQLLLQLKEEGLSWDDITARFMEEHFPRRSKGTLQVRYSTKLKPRPEMENSKKRRRSGSSRPKTARGPT